MNDGNNSIFLTIMVVFHEVSNVKLNWLQGSPAGLRQRRFRVTNYRNIEKN